MTRSEKTRVRTTSELGLPPIPSIAGTEPWRYYEQLRRAGGIVWDDEMEAWLVGSYDLARQMGVDEGTVWHHPRIPVDEYTPFGWSREDWFDFLGFGSALTPQAVADGPEHHRIHRWWMRAFSGRALTALGDTLIRPIAHSEIDRFAARGRADLHAEFTERVAPRVIAAAMGLPWRDDDWLERFLELFQQRIRLVESALEIGHADPDPAVVDAA